MVLPEYKLLPPQTPGDSYYTANGGYVPPGVGILPGNIPPMTSNQTPEGPANPMPKLVTGSGVGTTRTSFKAAGRPPYRGGAAMRRYAGVPQHMTQWLPHTTPNLDNNYQGIAQHIKMPIRQIVPGNVYPDTYRRSMQYAMGYGFINEQPIVYPQRGIKTVQYATPPYNPNYPGSPNYPPLSSAGYPRPTGRAMSYWWAMQNGVHPVPNVGRINRPAGYSIVGPRPIKTVGGYTMPHYTSPQVVQVGYTMPHYTSPQVVQVGYTMPHYTSPQVVQVGGYQEPYLHNYEAYPPYQPYQIPQHMKMPIKQIVPPGVYPDTYARKQKMSYGSGAAVAALLAGAVLGFIGGALIFTSTGRQIVGAAGRRAQTEAQYVGGKIASKISPPS